MPKLSNVLLPYHLPHFYRKAVRINCPIWWHCLETLPNISLSPALQDPSPHQALPHGDRRQLHHRLLTERGSDYYTYFAFKQRPTVHSLNIVHHTSKPMVKMFYNTSPPNLVSIVGSFALIQQTYYFEVSNTYACLTLCTIGMAKAKVFPLPVTARPMTSLKLYNINHHYTLTKPVKVHSPYECINNVMNSIIDYKQNKIFTNLPTKV